MLTRILAALFLTFALLPAAHAQFVQQGAKLVGTGAAPVPGAFPGVSQGTAVAVSADGNTAVVGGPGDNGNAGAAWVYVRTNGIWSQQGPKLSGTDATAAARQGESVGISADGNTAVVGGPRDNGSNGAVWVYVRTNGVWNQQGPKLVGAGGAMQGRAAAISGDGNTILIGGGDDQIGAAWVFTRTSGVWSQQGPKLVGTGGSAGALEGWSVAVSGDGNTAIIGGPEDNGGAGAAWVFTRTNGVWSQQGSKLAGALTVGLGLSVGMSADGNTVIANALFDNGVGGASIYTRSGGVWSRQGGNLAVTGQGWSVSISGNGNTAIVGGPDNGAGAAWVFARSNGVWSQQGPKLVGTGGSGTSFQGSSVALSGDGHTALVGGSHDSAFGAVWVYVFTPVHLVISAPNSVTAGDPFSFTVSAVDPTGSVATGYTGTVHFSTTDPIGELPSDSQLINGSGTFLATLKTGTGSFLTPTITAVDTVNQLITGLSNPISVQSAAASRFVFSATPASVISGIPFSLIISAFDRFGNLLQFNTAHVRFNSSDGAAILPAESTMPPVASFSAILKTVGPQTITVTDTGNSSATGTTDPIVVVSSSSNFNLAQGRQTDQSSTLSGAFKAVDGNLDGNFYNSSVTHTNLDTNAWWQVDLGASSAINSIVIWNRTDCCSTRLNDYWVFVSDTPFGSNDTPSTLLGRAGTFSSHQTTAPNPSTTITAGIQGRYVRVQLTGAGYLSLAEVQVFGPPGNSFAMNVAPGKPATQSSTLPGYATAGAAGAVDSNTAGSFFNGSVTHTDLDPNAWWQVDLGASTKVNSVVIWNRTDCCSTRLSDYWIFVSDTPFGPTDTPSTLQGRAGTSSSHQIAAPNPSAVISFGSTFSGVQGRYVRVQLTSAGYLSLAEVQVFGTPVSSSGSNVALGKAASQSSTLAGYTSAIAGSAVDNNFDGYFFRGSVTHTNLETNAWWQVDLGASTAIASISIWNRTDCCSTRLNDYWVFVSDTPFSPTDTPATLQTRAGTFASHQTTAPSPSATIAVGAQGRYVRVQLTGTDYLSLAEVQVISQ